MSSIILGRMVPGACRRTDVSFRGHLPKGQAETRSERTKKEERKIGKGTWEKRETRRREGIRVSWTETRYREEEMRGR